MERGFLIHKSYTSTEVYKLKSLLEEANKILDRTERNNRKIGNEERVNLQIVWESVKEILKNEDLKEEFYFDIEKARNKIEDPLDII